MQLWGCANDANIVRECGGNLQIIEYLLAFPHTGELCTNEELYKAILGSYLNIVTGQNNKVVMFLQVKV